MLNPAPELAQLRDIHLPHPIEWWPLAIGWFALIALACIAIMSFIFFTRRHYNHNRHKQFALNLLDIYQNDYKQQANSQLSSAQLSELLKRVALVYYPRKEVASLQGQAWIDFLTQTSKNVDFNTIRDLLLALPYQSPKDRDVTPLFNAAKRWIKQRRGQCLN